MDFLQKIVEYVKKGLMKNPQERVSSPTRDARYPLFPNYPIDPDFYFTLDEMGYEQKLEFYQTAELNPIVAACNTIIASEISRREYNINFPDSLTGAALQQAEMIKAFFSGCANESMTWIELFQNLSSFRNRGFSVVEIVWKSNAEGYYFPIGIYLIPHDVFRFTPDDAGTYTPTVLVTNSPAYGVKLNRWSWLGIFNAQSSRSPYGQPLFDTLYHFISTYEKSVKGYAAELQNGGQPHILATYDLDVQMSPADRASDFAAIKKYLESKTCLLPDTYTVSTQYFNNPKIIESYPEYFALCQATISQVICGHAQVLAQGDSGSRAAAQVYSETPRAITEGIANKIAEMMNQLIKYIYVVNGWDTEALPTFAFVERSDLGQIEKWLAIFERAQKLGLQISQEQIRRETGLQLPSDKNDSLATASFAKKQQPLLDVDLLHEKTAKIGNQMMDAAVQGYIKGINDASN